MMMMCRCSSRSCLWVRALSSSRHTTPSPPSSMLCVLCDPSHKRQEFRTEFLLHVQSYCVNSGSVIAIHTERLFSCERLQSTAEALKWPGSCVKQFPTLSPQQLICLIKQLTPQLTKPSPIATSPVYKPDSNHSPLWDGDLYKSLALDLNHCSPTDRSKMTEACVEAMSGLELESSPIDIPNKVSEQRIVYTKDFLLDLKFSPSSLIKPDKLPNLSIIYDEVSQSCSL